jgi:lipopolysaccharide/colanic/teichoic acid biosynthesis glycosyltransferase
VEAATPSELETEVLPAQFPLWKRLLDVTCVLLSLPILIPVGIVLGVFIKIVSPGPAFFRQQRVGYFGKRFMCLKFRTMKVNSDDTVHQAHLKQLMTSNRPTRKLDCGGDSRLIPGGLLLRSMGVDELPQLINVLRGEMSLVGPRPCTPYEFDLFSPRHKQRCGAPPGLTGLWQISGKNRTTFEEMINLDLHYVERMSPWLDLKIMALTPLAILALVWETKVLGKAGKRPPPAVVEHRPVFQEKAPARFPGTVPANE